MMAKIGSVALVTMMLIATTSAQKTGAPAGDFDAWVMALEWQPAWNLADCGSKQAVVDHTQNSSYAATHLSIHGLWPQTSANSSAYPQFCKGPQGDFTVCQSRTASAAICRPSDQTLQEFNTTTYWQKFGLEYAYSDLATHEWSKHGGCSGWDQQKYFEVEAQTLARVEQMSGPAYLTAHAGSSVPQKELSSAFNDMAFLRCTKCVLQGVWLTFTAHDTTKLPQDLADPLIVQRESCDACENVQVMAPVPCGSPTPAPHPGPTPTDHCVPDQRGPQCSYDKSTAGTAKDPCKKLSGCVRCAHSGYCTHAPLKIVV